MTADRAGNWPEGLSPVFTQAVTAQYTSLTPIAVPVRAEQIGQGFRLRFGHGLPGAPQGRACLTFHSHPPRFTGQENYSFVGDISAAGLEGVFCVDRLLPGVSLPGNRLAAALGFFGKRRQLAPRLQAEAARRDQPVPRIRLPDSTATPS